MSNFGRPAGPLSNAPHALTHVSKFRPTRPPPMSKFRTQRGPSVSNSPKKGRHSCQSPSADVSNSGAPRGPCQSSGRRGALESKVSAQLSKFRHRPGPCVNLSKSRRCGGPRVSKFPHPVGPCVNLSKCRRCVCPRVSKFPHPVGPCVNLSNRKLRKSKSENHMSRLVY